MQQQEAKSSTSASPAKPPTDPQWHTPTPTSRTRDTARTDEMRAQPVVPGTTGRAAVAVGSRNMTARGPVSEDTDLHENQQSQKDSREQPLNHRNVNNVKTGQDAAR